MKVNGAELSTKRATSERAIIRVVVMSLATPILACWCSFLLFLSCVPPTLLYRCCAGNVHDDRPIIAQISVRFG
jgi:hypothetical protein